MTSFFALLVFVIFMVGTPGPANLLLMVSGLNFGMRRSLSFIGGLVTGKLVLNIMVGFGLGVFLSDSPQIKTLFSVFSACYIIYLGIRSWPSPSPVCSKTSETRRLHFFDGLFVHPLSPKTWVMLVLAWNEFAPALGDFWMQLLTMILTFSVCQILFHGFWCWLGVKFEKNLSDSAYLTKFVICLTVAVVLFALLY